MWPITLHPLTRQISLSDLSPDRLTQYSRISIHIWTHLCMCVGRRFCVCVSDFAIQTHALYSQWKLQLLYWQGPNLSKKGIVVSDKLRPYLSLAYISDRSNNGAVLKSHTHTHSVPACPVSIYSMVVLPLNTNFLGHDKMWLYVMDHQSGD